MASNVQGAGASWKSQILLGGHNFNSSGGDTFKIALYYQGSGLGYGTTAYSATGEVSGTGYTAGGLTLTNGVSPAVSGSVAYWTPSANPTWTGLTITGNFDCALIYNASKSNEAVMVLTFPAQTINAGTFTMAMPTNAAGTALLQLS